MGKLEKTVHGDLENVIKGLEEKVCSGKNAFTRGEVYSTTLEERKIEMRSYERYNLVYRYGIGVSILFVESAEDKIDITVMVTGTNYGILGLDMGDEGKTLRIFEEAIQDIG